MCTICRRQFPKKDLIRLVKAKKETSNNDACANLGGDGDACLMNSVEADKVIIDESGKMPGRGYYVCKGETCLETALKGSRLEKCVGTKIKPEALGKIKTALEDVRDKQA